MALPFLERCLDIGSGNAKIATGLWIVTQNWAIGCNIVAAIAAAMEVE